MYKLQAKQVFCYSFRQSTNEIYKKSAKRNEIKNKELMTSKWRNFSVNKIN